jgi:hypothetical protein
MSTPEEQAALAAKELGDPVWAGAVAPPSATRNAHPAYLFAGPPHGPRMVQFDRGQAMHGDDGRRVVAAWNATRGIPTEALESGVIEELSAALRAYLEYEDSTAWFGQYPKVCRCERCEAARAALARAEGRREG